MKLLLASNNQHKFQEFDSIFSKIFGNKIQLITPNEIMEKKIEIEENGKNFHENALIKAKGFYEATIIPCFSDDSGLEVDILNGLPGIISARFSGKSATDFSNRKKLIEVLSEYKGNSFPAQFKCVICYYDGTQKFYSEGIARGQIILEERGNSGFGYDPLFIPDNYNKTFAEMDYNLKNQLSHRAKAIDGFVDYLINRLNIY